MPLEYLGPGTIGATYALSGRPLSRASRPFVGPMWKGSKGRVRSAVPAILGVGGPIGADAYACMSSTIRPSLQPYLASKSAFTVAAS